LVADRNDEASHPGFTRWEAIVHNEDVGRVSKAQVALGMLLAGAVGLQALASCGIWLWLISATPACCPSHAPGGMSEVTPRCCNTPDPGARVLAASAVLTAPGLRAAELFPVPRSPIDPRASYYVSLPVAARGHSLPSLSALLI
jgi:hypothetical protein